MDAGKRTKQKNYNKITTTTTTQQHHQQTHAHTKERHTRQFLNERRQNEKKNKFNNRTVLLT